MWLFIHIGIKLIHVSKGVPVQNNHISKALNEVMTVLHQTIDMINTLSCTDNTVDADGLATQGARVSAAMVLTKLFQFQQLKG